MRLLAAIACLVLGVAMLSLPALFARTWHGWILACTRSGFAAGTCHAEPTLRDDLGRGNYQREHPRPYFLPQLSVDDLDYVEVEPNHYDWMLVHTKPGYRPHEGENGVYRVPLDGISLEYEKQDVSDAERAQRAAKVKGVVEDWNAFIHDPSRDAFRLRSANYPQGSGRWVDGSARALGALAIVAALMIFVRGRKRTILRPAT